jgi:hypothetical protein
MSRVGFESTIPMSELAKTFHILDRAPTVIGVILDQRGYFSTQEFMKPTTPQSLCFLLRTTYTRERRIDRRNYKRHSYIPVTHNLLIW